jgi:hypothetical protein
MRRRTWILAAAAVLAAAATVGVVVTSAAEQGTPAPHEQRGSTATLERGKNVIGRDRAVKFAECMRANGVSAFPDPDAKGALTIDAVANGSSVDTDSLAFERALSTCKDLEPPGFTGYRRSVQEQAAALEFAQCVRDNGVRDFPDPGPGDPLVDTRRIPSSDTPGGLSILNAAMRKCGRYASAAGVRGSS